HQDEDGHDHQQDICPKAHDQAVQESATSFVNDGDRAGINRRQSLNSVVSLALQNRLHLRSQLLLEEAVVEILTRGDTDADPPGLFLLPGMQIAGIDEASLRSLQTDPGERAARRTFAGPEFRSECR